MAVIKVGIVMMLVVILTASVYTLDDQTQPGRNYAYLVITGHHQNNILIISASDPTATPMTKNFPVPEGWALTRQVFLSPDGQWIAAVIHAVDQISLTVELYNLVSGESHEVIQGTMSPNGQNIAWSPDGRYLALNVAQETGTLNTFLYSMADGKLTNLTNDNEDHEDIGWSPTSIHLVTFIRICPDKALLCNGKVELFDLANSTRKTSSDLPILFSDSIGCKSVISPDAQYVAFVAHCFSYPEVTTDVYLWDAAADTVAQVTNFFDAETPIHATYNLAWLDTQKLLIGVDYQLFTQPVQYQLAAYDVAPKSLATLSTAAGASFALNPTSDQIAIRLHSAGSAANVTERQDQLAVVSASDLARNAAALNSSAAATTTSVLSGCGLQWSPNGVFLSYATHTEGDCQEDTSSFVFVDATGKTVDEHRVSSDGVSTDGVIIPLGWVAG